MKWSPYYEIGLYSRINFRYMVDRILFEQNQKLDAIAPRKFPADILRGSNPPSPPIFNSFGQQQSFFNSLFGIGLR